MGTILEFPADAASRRPGVSIDGGAREAKGGKAKSGQTKAGQAKSSQGMGIVLILPVVRIERQFEETNGRGPEEGTAAPGRRRRRR